MLGQGGGGGMSPRPMRPMGGRSGGMGGDRRDPRLAILRMLIDHGIKSYATGGIAYEPQLAVVGDSGPEAMVPLGDRFGGAGSHWQNLINKVRQRGMSATGGAAGTTRGLLAGNKAALGPGYLRERARAGALQTADSMRRRNFNVSRLSGLDPQQQRQAMIDSDISANEGLSGALNAADLQDAGGFQDWLRRVLGQERGYQFQSEESQRQRDWEESQQPSFLGEALGSVVGAGSQWLAPRPRK